MYNIGIHSFQKLYSIYIIVEHWLYSPCIFIVCVCAQLYLTLCNSMDCSPPGSSVHGILQERILERVAKPFSRGSSRQRLYIFEPPEKPPSKSNCILLSLQCDTLDLQWSVTFSFILSSYSLPNFFCCCCYLVKSNNHV